MTTPALRALIDRWREAARIVRAHVSGRDVPALAAALMMAEVASLEERADELEAALTEKVQEVSVRPNRYVTKCWKCGMEAPRGGNCATCDAYNSEGK